MDANRMTGRIVGAVRTLGDAMVDFGNCEKAPFTCLPKSKF